MRTIGTTRRRGWLLAVGVMASAATPAWAATCEDDATAFAYVANHWMYVFGPDLAAEAVASQTGVRTAPLGDVYVGPASADELDITVDDRNTLRGEIPLFVFQYTDDYAEYSLRTECVPAGERTTLDEIEPGRHLELTVLNDAYGRQLCGGPGGTAGVLTVHP